MKRIEVSISEIDKGSKQLTLLNLRDEVVNVLYKETVANSTKSDLLFFILIFFLSNRIDGKSLLSKILDDAIPKFKKLNKDFLDKNRKLEAGEYSGLIQENELAEIFKYDVFFILIEAVLDIQEIESKFTVIINQDKTLIHEFKIIKEKYFQDLKDEIENFKKYEIKDDRLDYDGNYHDLSKSVYRTVRMRNSRNLDLNLQKYTQVKSITSNSPIDFTFIQNIDVQILFDLWTKYHLAEYLKVNSINVFNLLKNHSEFKVNWGELVIAWIVYKNTSSKDKKDNQEAKESFEKEKEKEKNIKFLTEVTGVLVRSVVDADLQLKKEISKVRSRITRLSKDESIYRDEEEIKRLEDRLKGLLNLKVKATIIDDDKKSS